MRVLICDDYALLASSLSLHLRRHGHATTVVTHPADALPVLRSARFDVCLLDLRFGRDPLAGLASLPSLREASPGTAVIALSAVHDDDVTRAALHAGASAVADRGMSLSDVARLVTQAGAGLLPAQLRPPASVCSGRITKREREVLDLVARGLNSDEIGWNLGISAHTVRSHVEAARGKLAARNRLEAVAATTWSGSGQA